MEVPCNTVHDIRACDCTTLRGIIRRHLTPRKGPDMRQLTFMWKDSSSVTGDCPALYEVEGGYVVQGKILEPAELAQLRDHGADETAVFVPANVLDRLAGR